MPSWLHGEHRSSCHSRHDRSLHFLDIASGDLPKTDHRWPADEHFEGGGAWLRLADGRECEIQVERAVAGSGLTEFSGAKGILDLR